MPAKKELFVCGICGKSADWTKQHQRRHIETHTGTNHPGASGSTNSSLSERHASQEKSRQAWMNVFRDNPDGLAQLIKRALELRDSKPPEYRHTGGRFDSGPLADKMTEGMPTVFDKKGRMKECLRWMLSFCPENSSKRQALRAIVAPNTLPPPPSSHPNLRWILHSKDNVPFTPIGTNLWSPRKYPDWTCPDGSDGNMQDPSLVWLTEPQCDLCGRPDTCCCINSAIFKEMAPKAVPAGSMGEGTIAQREYKQNQLLRELTGELVPLGQYEDGWAADLCRDDDTGKPVRWCSVHPLIYGNWARKMNHSCEFNAQFVSMRVSQRWRVMIQAVKDIQPGEPVTVDYGAEYWEGSPHECMCGSDRCLYRGKIILKKEEGL